MRRALVPLLPCVLALAACSGGGGGGQVLGTRETWVASKLILPTNASEATTYGFDVDGDGSVDNQLGDIMAALTGVGSFNFQGAVDAAILTGAAVQLVETTTGASTAVAFSTGVPAIAPCTDPSNLTTCGRHLNGTTSFTASPAVDPALVGTGTSVAFQAGPGAATLQVPLFGGHVLALPLLMARASFTRSGTTLSGKVGGAIPMAAVNGTIIPALYDWIVAAIALDCTGTTCTPGSLGETLLALFDANHDGTVTLAEVQDNALISPLFAPDVDTNGDHVLDALSAGFGYQLVGAVF
jgi:hypothetical protein